MKTKEQMEELLPYYLRGKSREHIVASLVVAYKVIDEYREESERLSRAIEQASGWRYNGTGPMDPGPDPTDYDVWCVEQMGERIKRLEAALKGMLDATEGIYMDKLLPAERVAKLALHYNKDPED